ncbi:MAG: PEP-CTERM sorting domain-containing protein [Minwuiales bacterium]|nr:PEP-CTERM sorting domain-containing protein [Minwuiales bacterium]
MTSTALRTAACAAIICGALAMGGVSASAAVVQINTPQTPPDWNENSATQTGTIGSTPISVTTTNLPWNTTFNDENGLYASTVFGSLVQPAGTTGDLFTLSIQEGDVFSVSVRFGGALLDPIFYIVDVNTVGAEMSFPSGGTTKEVSAAGTFVGDVLTHVAAGDRTDAAVQYTGLFPANSEFVLGFDFDTNNFSRELIALGIAATEVMENGGSSDVPAPATLTLLGAGLAGLGWARRRMLRVA